MEAGGEGLDEEEGVVWWCVMIVEYRNAFNKLAHDPFCTACPGLDRCPGLSLFADTTLGYNNKKAYYY